MGIWLLTYNSRHQQTKVETESGHVQENRYDVENLRFELLENGRRTSFVYHNGGLLHAEGGNEKQISYHLGAGIDALQRGQDLSYYHRDEQLSTAYITGGNGEIQNNYLYDAFGTEVETKEQFPNRIRYTGQQYDELTEQYYLRARYYNPILGRFMQEDVYQGDGLNLYAYCGNNPVVYYDPTGYAGASQQSGYGCPPNGNIGGNDNNNAGVQDEDGYQVSDERRRHILEGEDPINDPGHGPNRGFTDSAFPDTWTDDQAIAAIERVANSPDSTWKQSTGPGYQTAPITIGGPDPAAPSTTNNGGNVRFIVEGQNHSLNIRVIVEPEGKRIITGYPHD